MNILITGGTGLLGMALQKTAAKGNNVFSIYSTPESISIPLPFPSKPANVTEKARMQAIFDWSQPDVVIHTAAIGSVDFAEKNREQAHFVNVGGVKVVCELCNQVGARLIHISSNAVFDGKRPFYAENASTNPVNYYGQLKLEGEKLIELSGLDYAVVRPILFYGWPYPGRRDNLVTWCIKSLEAGKQIKVVNDVFSKPLFVGSCAKVVWAIVMKMKSGIYHVAGKNHITLYELAVRTAKVFDLDSELISPVPSDYFENIAPRPKDTSFDTSKMERDLGITPIGVEEGLQMMKATRPGNVQGSMNKAE